MRLQKIFLTGACIGLLGLGVASAQDPQAVIIGSPDKMTICYEDGPCTFWHAWPKDTPLAASKPLTSITTVIIGSILLDSAGTTVLFRGLDGSYAGSCLNPTIKGGHMVAIADAVDVATPKPLSDSNDDCEITRHEPSNP